MFIRAATRLKKHGTKIYCHLLVRMFRVHIPENDFTVQQISKRPRLSVALRLVFQESLPLVGRLSNANFAQYERTRLPMLIMFLELPGKLNLYGN